MELTLPSDAVVGWMASLADPKRLRILHLIEGQELGVIDLCEVLQSPQSTISRHLKLLSDQAWVRSRKQGTNHFYQMILDELDPAARRLWLLARQQSTQWPAISQDRLRLERRLQERGRDSQTFFAGAAAEWDKIRGELYGEKFSASACAALLPNTHVVADIGCGTGPIIASIAPFVRKVIGVDNSSPMLKAAARRLALLPNVELRRGELADVPIETAECDAALLVLALTYATEPAAAILEMARIVKPGGTAIVVDLITHDREDFRRQMGQRWPGFDLEKIRGWMTDAGLAPIVAQPLAPEPNVKGPALFVASGRKVQ